MPSFCCSVLCFGSVLYPPAYIYHWLRKSLEHKCLPSPSRRVSIDRLICCVLRHMFGYPLSSACLHLRTPSTAVSTRTQKQAQVMMPSCPVMSCIKLYCMSSPRLKFLGVSVDAFRPFCLHSPPKEMPDA
ncbi:hypothetical protein J1605_022134 [Eschrichtius robustus]|uniref:Secreted protein n=1 Tax=Eschrichtius robustus TaxID=9764 RepID=A0AB34HEM3_ESCRO|nr:hypothetical protein J1605_022134 [Eschrichtius robustus]